MTVVTSATDAYLAEFERTTGARPGGEPAWLNSIRRRAILRFAELGFPTTRDEEWRFTNIQPIAEASFRLAGDGEAGLTPDEIERFGFGRLDAVRLVFVNGRYAPHLSRVNALATKVRVSNLRSVIASDPGLVDPYLAKVAPYEQHALAALNTAFLDDGAFVWIPAHAVIEDPIHLLYMSTAPGEPLVSHPRALIIAGEHSQVSLLESYAAPTDHVYFTNAVSELIAGDNAVVDHYRLQRESARGFHIGLMHVRAQRGATVTSHSLSIGGGLVRNEVMAVLDGEGVDCTLNGLYLADGERLVDNHTTIDHAKPHCGSHEIYKGILSGRARAVFNGKIIVRPDAQKTDAKQTNKALLLSDDAQINTKPQLEIFANDVKCTHGAAIGQLDEDAIFYLRTRGLGLKEARSILIHAFAGDVLNRVKIEPLRTDLERTLLARLPRDIQ